MATKKMLKDRDAYAGYTKAKRMEYQDSQMIHEDHNAIANLPQEVKMKEYPKFRYGLDPDLDDTSVGIDKQMYGDMHNMKKGMSPRKY